MPPAQRAGGPAMLIGQFPLAGEVGELDGIASAGAEGFGAEGEGDGGADIVGHFLEDHVGVDGAPVPVGLVGGAEVGDAGEDERLDFDAGGAVLVPDGRDPEVEVEVVAGGVDEGGGGRAGRGGEVEGGGRGGVPVRGHGVGPSGDEEVDADGVFEEVGDFLVGGEGAGEEECGLGTGAEVGDVDRCRCEAGGGVLWEGLEHGAQAVGAAFERCAFLDSVLYELGAYGEEKAGSERGFTILCASVHDYSCCALVVGAGHIGFGGVCCCFDAL